MTKGPCISAVLLGTAGGSIPALAAAIGTKDRAVRRCLVEIDISIRPKGVDIDYWADDEQTPSVREPLAVFRGYPPNKLLATSNVSRRWRIESQRT